MGHRTIFFGSSDRYLCIEAKKHNANAWLLTANTADQFIDNNLQDITVYTSIADWSPDIESLYKLLCKADTIVYCPPSDWPGNSYDCTDPRSSARGLTETLLLLLPKSIYLIEKDKFYQIPNPIPLMDQRKTDHNQLWIAGCSISHGVGVDKNSKYGALLSQKLGLPVSYLTRPGSAIDWATDQIIRSDIRSGDFVILGITTWERLTYVHEHKFLGLTPWNYKNCPHYQDIVSQESLFSNQTFYNHLYSIHRVINFCKKIGAKLSIAGLLLGNYALLNFLKSLDNYIHIDYELHFKGCEITSKFIDVGSDSMHPGPKQHQIYTDIILDFIQK